MKKYLLIFCVLCLLLVGCSKKEEPPVVVAPPAVAPELLGSTTYRLESWNLGTELSLPTQTCRIGDLLYFTSATQPDAEAAEDFVWEESTALHRLDLTAGTLTELCTYPAATADDESYTAVADIFPGEDGSVWIMENTTHYIFDLPKNFDERYENKWEYYQYRGDTTVLRQLAADGTSLQTVTLVNLQSSLNAAAQIGEYLYCAQGQNLLRMTLTGETVDTVLTPGWITALSVDNGSLCLVMESDAGDTCRLYRMNPEDFSLDDGMDLPSGIYAHVGLAEDRLFFTDRGNVFAWNLADGTTEKLIDWQDYNKNRSYVGAVFALEEGKFAALSQKSPGDPLELLVLTPDETAARPVTDLTLGVLWPDENTMDLVLSFNAVNHGGKIRVADYSEYDTLGQDGLARLRLDLASGEGPDLLFSPDAQHPLTALAKNQLQDLTPYLEKDQALIQQGLMTSVFDALRQEDGTLLTLTPSFHLSTTVGRADLLRPTPMGVSRAIMLVQGLEGDGFAPIEPYTTRQAAFHGHLTRLAGTYFKDTGTDLHPDLISGGLALSGLYPETLDWKQYEKEGIADSWYRVRMGRQLYLPGVYSRFSDLAYDMSAVGEDAILCGWPDAPDGHVLEVWESWGITTNCHNDTLAWSFLRTLLTETYQTTHSLSGLPTNRSAFSRLGRAAMQSGTTSFLPVGKEMIEVSSRLTQAQYNALLDAVNHATTLARPVPEGLSNAIYAALSDYFAGKVTAEEAAVAAQAAASLYAATNP